MSTAYSLQKGALLRSEFNELYNALFVKADKYIDVVRLLSERKSGLTRAEISQATNIEGSFFKQGAQKS